LAPKAQSAKAAIRKIIANPNVKIYDVRPPAQFAQGHIPGAMPLAAGFFAEFSRNLPEDRSTPLVWYGNGGFFSHAIREQAGNLGYQDGRIYVGGYPDWSLSEPGMVEIDWLKQAISAGTPHILIDSRPVAAIINGHIPGAVAIAPADLERNRSQFPADRDAPIIFYGPEAKAAAGKVISWGYRAVTILPVSFAGWEAVGSQVDRNPIKTTIDYKPAIRPGAISRPEFSEAAGSSAGKYLLIDVRNPEELVKGAIPGARNIPVPELGRQAPELPRDREIILYSNRGIRAAMAHNILEALPIKNRYLAADLRFTGSSFTATGPEKPATQ
jgi:rhodanese-related sulfurtransferase